MPFDLTLLAAESVVFVSLVVDGFRRYFANMSSEVSEICFYKTKVEEKLILKSEFVYTLKLLQSLK